MEEDEDYLTLEELVTWIHDLNSLYTETFSEGHKISKSYYNRLLVYHKEIKEILDFHMKNQRIISQLEKA
jgi:hypothetical protein